MATTALLQIGPKWEMIKKGDIIKLVNGQIFTFLEMKRTKWVGKDKDGKSWLIHTPAKEIIGFDESVKEALVAPTKLKLGELFAIDGKRDTYMFKTMAPTGKIKAVNIADGSNWTIDSAFNIKKIDIKKLKEELV